MIVIGLTGSIGMGKSTVAAEFRRLGVRVCNADALVHQLMGKGGAAVSGIESHFPGVVKSGAIDRKALGDIVFHDKQKLALLEHILHPLVVAAENHFLDKEASRGARLAVLEIPLLFETGAQKRCDVTVVASAPRFIQRQRVMKRPNMTEAKLDSILRLQMPDRKKRELADVVIDTGLGRRHSFKKVALLIRELRGKP